MYPNGDGGGMVSQVPVTYGTAVEWESDAAGVLYVGGGNDVVLAEWTRGSWLRVEYVTDPNEPTE